MTLSDFLRLYPMRAPQIMWFLGAGASAASGIPTAYHMIWEFKRSLYCSAHRVSVASCSDLSSDFVRARLQRYCATLTGAPAEDSSEEYSFYFEAAHGHEADRRRYIDRLASEGKPSFGHLALAAMFKMDKARVVWTTNFDRVIEDATAMSLGTSARLVVATIGEPELARQAMTEGRWPVLIKLHGDYHSRKLKNTGEELCKQDGNLRKCLVESCNRHGLAVVGYSGRDESIMDALEEALDAGAGFPAGLFWFNRPESPVMPRVTRLISRASTLGVDAHLIENDNFDELLGDVLALIPDASPEVTVLLASRKKRISVLPVPTSVGGWPIIRLNAFPLSSYPSVCRRIECKIGGFTDVRKAVEEAGSKVTASRRQMGVILFGSDDDAKNTFQGFGITTFDLHSIEPRRLRYDSAELSLLYDSFCRGLTRQCPVKVFRKRSSWIVAVDPVRQSEAAWDALRAAIGPISGRIAKTNINWAEACRVRLEYRLDRLWLLLDPTIWFESLEDASVLPNAKEFVRNRLTARYNIAWNKIIDGWADVLIGCEDMCEVRAFGIGDGVDAVFCVSRKPAFSWRGGVR